MSRGALGVPVWKMQIHFGNNLNITSFPRQLYDLQGRKEQAKARNIIKLNKFSGVA